MCFCYVRQPKRGSSWNEEPAYRAERLAAVKQIHLGRGDEDWELSAHHQNVPAAQGHGVADSG
ncbi:unnamed protein product [Amoebophrya sp. A25]|nr:unnamed protein product [Amoebophrya sp. A25]|eukprot:GSA25T00012768001.1